MKRAWHRLRVARRSELVNADSALAVQAAGIGALDAAASEASLGGVWHDFDFADKRLFGNQVGRFAACLES